MLQPNWDLFLWIMLIVWFMEAIAKIVLGYSNAEKDTRYDAATMLTGLIALMLVFFVFAL